MLDIDQISPIIENPGLVPNSPDGVRPHIVDNVLTVVKDTDFRTFCEEMMTEWDSDIDGVLSLEEAAAVKRISLPSQSGITSLAGIEYFTGLTYLGCSENRLTTLDLSYNKALVSVNCNSNALTSLILPRESKLISVSCELNSLSTLDLSGCTELERFSCGGNQLLALDVSRCTKLTSLDCWGNLIGALDMSHCPLLEKLVCQVNEMTSLILTGCTKLTELNANSCLLTGIDISDCKDLWLCDIETNPGDANGVFHIPAWFDGAEVPKGKIPGRAYNYLFPTDWFYFDGSVTAEYTRAA
jgi:Leucine-rich repeat (LRR) protein